MKKDHKRAILRKGRVEKASYQTKQTSMKGAEARYGKDLEDWPEREGNRISRRRMQGDDLGPLKRFLRSQIGKPWNKIWSEICEWTKGNSVDSWHFRLHASREVDIHQRWKQGDLYSYEDELHPNGLYVDDYGILRKAKKKYPRTRVPFPRDGKPPYWTGDAKYPYKKIDGKTYVNCDGWKEVTPEGLVGGVWGTLPLKKLPNTENLRFEYGHPFRTSWDGKILYRPRLRMLSAEAVEELGL